MEAPSTIVVLDLDRSAETLAPVGDVPLNHGVKVTSSNADPATDRFACDGDMHTAWQADTGTKQPWIQFDLGAEKTIARAILCEGAYEGELADIHCYQVEVRVTAHVDWQRVENVNTWDFDTTEEENLFECTVSVFTSDMRYKPQRPAY